MALPGDVHLDSISRLPLVKREEIVLNMVDQHLRPDQAPLL
jgi:hypothetical protein